MKAVPAPFWLAVIALLWTANVGVWWSFQAPRDLLFCFCVVGAMSVGIFYVPAVIVLAVAAALPRRTIRESPVR